MRKIRRKTIVIPSYLLVQPCGGHAVDASQFGIENHSLSAKRQNGLLDLLDWNQLVLLTHGASSRGPLWIAQRLFRPRPQITLGQ